MLARFLQLEREQWLPPSVISRLQWSRFRAILQHAFDSSPFYRTRFQDAGINPDDIRSRGDLSKIPITTRADLAMPENLVAEGYSPAKMKASTTSGSTGRKTKTYFDQRVWILGKYLLKARARAACGVRPWHRIALFPEDRPPNNRFRRILLRQRSFPVVEQLGTILPEVQRYNPHVLYGFPSFLVRMGRLGGESLSPSLIFTSGEVLDGHTRDEIAELFRAPVFDIFGCTEVKEIAWECPAHEGYHINSDWLLVESLEGDDDASGPEGTLLVTSLLNFGMPLIRYQLGDTGRLLSARCSCGRGLPLMTPCFGRSVDYFVLPGGEQVSPYALTCSVEKIEGIEQYQVVQEESGGVVVKVVPKSTFDDASAARLRSALEPLVSGLSVEVLCVERIPREQNRKFKIVMSKVQSR